MILESQDESDFDDARRTNYPVATTPLVANQRDYAFGVTEKVLKVKRVDFTWNGGTNWYRGEPIDSGSLNFGLGFTQASSTDAELDQNFIQISPKYDFAYGSVWVYPMPTATDVSNGSTIRVEWERQILPFTSADYTSVITDSTAVPGFDDPFHIMLAYGAAFEFASSKQLPQLKQIQDKLQEDEIRLRTAYSKKELDRRLLLQTDSSVSYR